MSSKFRIVISHQPAQRRRLILLLIKFHFLRSQQTKQYSSLNLKNVDGR